MWINNVLFNIIFSVIIISERDLLFCAEANHCAISAKATYPVLKCPSLKYPSRLLFPPSRILHIQVENTADIAHPSVLLLCISTLKCSCWKNIFCSHNSHQIKHCSKSTTPIIWMWVVHSGTSRVEHKGCNLVIFHILSFQILKHRLQAKCRRQSRVLSVNQARRRPVSAICEALGVVWHNAAETTVTHHQCRDQP